MYLIVCAPACVVHSMQMWLSLRCEGACWSEIIQIVARRGKGDTWRVEHLTQDDELELGVDGVCVGVLCVCGGQSRVWWMSPTRAFAMTAEISQPGTHTHTNAHSHQQALQMAKRTPVTLLGFLWDVFVLVGSESAEWNTKVALCYSTGLADCMIDYYRETPQCSCLLSPAHTRSHSLPMLVV